ncbi:hypothetical protein ACIBCT_01690 [Streptosporangium sp. NPDC050855]
MLRIDDLPAGVSPLEGEELEVVAGMEPNWSVYVCTASKGGDCWKE